MHLDLGTTIESDFGEGVEVQRVAAGARAAKGRGWWVAQLAGAWETREGKRCAYCRWFYRPRDARRGGKRRRSAGGGGFTGFSPGGAQGGANNANSSANATLASCSEASELFESDHYDVIDVDALECKARIALLIPPSLSRR